jgi:inositol oxygenase
LGKVLAHPAFGSEPQWAVVGDTFPVGCAFDPAIIHAASFASNPDASDARYASACGVYAPGCGLSAVDMSWGHDEYMAQVMRRNGCTLPAAATHIVRFHSFYAWHREGAYGHLTDAEDADALRWVRAFNACDLYSKSIAPVDVAALRPYYEGLARKYFPAEKLRW